MRFYSRFLAHEELMAESCVFFNTEVLSSSSSNDEM